jgi:hypothetical protein
MQFGQMKQPEILPQLIWIGIYMPGYATPLPFANAISE